MRNEQDAGTMDGREVEDEVQAMDLISNIYLLFCLYEWMYSHPSGKARAC